MGEAAISTPNIVLLVALVVAAVIDLRTHRIPNWLTFTLMAVGLAVQASVGGGLAVGVVGLVVAFLVHYALWSLGIDAAGDAKLFMAVGAWLGWAVMMEATLWRLLLHVPMAVIVLTVQKRWDNFRAALRWSLLSAQGQDQGARPEPTWVPLGAVIALSVPLAMFTDVLGWFG